MDEIINCWYFFTYQFVRASHENLCAQIRNAPTPPSWRQMGVREHVLFAMGAGAYILASSDRFMQRKVWFVANSGVQEKGVKFGAVVLLLLNKMDTQDCTLNLFA